MMDKNYWQNKLSTLERDYSFHEGYKLLFSPWNTIQKANHAFISLNPGRAPDGADLRVISDERGNSYEVEEFTTKSPLTAQFLKLCSFLYGVSAYGTDRVLV